MGCASSKQWKSKCKHCNAPYVSSPATKRSLSMPVHHPPSRKGDTYHVVALTSSTLGSLPVDEEDYVRRCATQTHYHQRHSHGRSYYAGNSYTNHDRHRDRVRGCEDFDLITAGKNKSEFELGVIEAKAWSRMIDEKMTRAAAPTTPVRTPPGEPETINAWELMEGLDDISPLRPTTTNYQLRSFSFHHLGEKENGSIASSPSSSPSPSLNTNTNPIQMEGPDDNQNDFSNNKLRSRRRRAVVSDFDPQVISAFRKALQELSPSNPFHLAKRNGAVVDHVLKSCCEQHHPDQHNNNNNNKINGMMVDRGFQQDDHLKLNGFHHHEENGAHKEELCLLNQNAQQQHVHERVVLYFTSLRGIRKTYENCCNVRMILKGLGLRVDERDVSLDSGFKEELRELLADNGSADSSGLPRVFLGKKYIGGAEEIQRLHEDGHLEKVLEGCEKMEEEEDGRTCEACGDVRFVPCETCSGSCKIYYEEEEEEDELEEYREEAGDAGFQKCPDCNENGLIRCPVCC